MDPSFSLTRVLKSFEREWESAPPAAIEPHLAGVTGDQRKTLLQELVCVDMEYRWRSRSGSETAGEFSFSATAATRLIPGDSTIPVLLVDDYLAQFPELGDAATVDSLLIEEEFRVRCRWGEQPETADFLSRFPLQEQKLRARLETIRNEFVSSTVPTAESVLSISVDEFLNRVASSRLLLGDALPELRAKLTAAGPFTDGMQAGEWMVGKQRLTTGQLRILLKGPTCPLVLGAYVILEELGAGGMGQVFKARHTGMNREVALKTLKGSLPASSDSNQRFQREVQAAARLVHPNVVVAHDAGEAEGVRYLVMEYVEGQNLSELVRQSGVLPVGRAVELIRQAAEGLKYAHQRGVIHRDVKPSNLLLSNDGLVKVLDLGLARFHSPNEKQVDAQVEPLTSANTVMGTADYMAPEQASETRTADARADIYSLGCTLYFLLTAERVFPAATMWQTLTYHHERPVPSLSTTRTDIPPALNSVFQKMLAKSPSERYQSMQDVIAALAEITVSDHQNDVSRTTATRHLEAGARLSDRTAPASRVGHREPGDTAPSDFANGETVLLSSNRRASNRRGRVIQIAAVLAVIGLAVGGWTFWKPSATPEIATERPASVPAVVIPNSNVPPLIAPKAFADALRRERIPQRELVSMTQGHPEKAPSELVAVLGDSRFRVWEQVAGLDFSPDGRLLAAAAYLGPGVVWNVETGEPLAWLDSQAAQHSIRFSPDGKRLAVSSKVSVDVWDTNDWRRIVSHGESGDVYDVTFSSDSNRVAYVTSRPDLTRLVKVQNADGSMAEEYVIERPQDWPDVPIRTGALTFADDYIAVVVVSVGNGNLVSVERIDLKSGERTRFGDNRMEGFTVFSRDGSRLASGMRRAISIWDVRTGQFLNQLPVRLGVGGLALDSTGEHLIVRHESISEVELWNVQSGTRVFTAPTQATGVDLQVAISPNGQTIAASLGLSNPSLDIVHRDQPSGSFVINGHGAKISGLAMTSDGSRVISSGWDGTVREWDLSTGLETRAIARFPKHILNMALHPLDRMTTVTLGTESGVGSNIVTQSLTSPKQRTTTVHESVSCIAFSRDGQWRATSGYDYSKQSGVLRIHDAETDEQLRLMERPGQNILDCVFHPDGQMIAYHESVAHKSDEAVLAPVSGDTEVFRFKKAMKPLVFSPDGQWLLTRLSGSGFALWSTETGRQVRSIPDPQGHPKNHGRDPWVAAFSPDGSRLAGSTCDGQVHLWDPQTGVKKKSITIGPPQTSVTGLAFTPDGRHLVAAVGNGTICVLRLDR